MSSTPAPRSPRVRTRTLARMKADGTKITMLTSYDAISAAIFSDAGIDVLLVGDSVGNTVLGHESVINTRHEDIVLFTGAVARGASRPLIISDLAFGTYQVSAEDAVRNGIELVRAGAHAVKLEGGTEVVPHVRRLVEAGIPVCGHLGFTPQSVHALGGHRVQGRESAAAAKLREDAQALQEAGVFALVFEMVPASLAGALTRELDVPTIGIGAGAGCDGQVLVWQDMSGLSDFNATFVRHFANLREELSGAATRYRDAVVNGQFPGPEHEFS